MALTERFNYWTPNSHVKNVNGKCDNEYGRRGEGGAQKMLIDVFIQHLLWQCRCMWSIIVRYSEGTKYYLFPCRSGNLLVPDETQRKTMRPFGAAFSLFDSGICISRNREK